MKTLFFYLIICFAVSKLSAQNLEKYESKLFISGTDTLPYRILYPDGWDKSKKYPLVIFLHGSGERGNDNEAQLVHGGSLFLKPEVRQQFPAIIVFPQCQKKSFWSNVEMKVDQNGKQVFNFPKDAEPTKAMNLLIGLVEKLQKQSFTDKRKMYAGGLSMGGMGTFELLWRKPKMFAAAFAICGGGNVEHVKKYRKVPLWIFHGEKDDVVLPVYSEMIVNKLKEMGKEPKFTLYPDANHNSWDSAFAEPDLLPWLFSKSR